MLSKLTEMEQNWIIFIRYGFIKNLWQIHLRESHMNFIGKKKSVKPHEQNYMAWLVKQQ